MTVTVTYKDRIFRMIFKQKKNFLDLYNAMNNSNYSNPDDLTVTTLENAIYMNMKNDVSFLFHVQLMLYEHQSTKNPNIPLRNLFYVSDIYSKLTKDKNLFGTKLIRIPQPRFVVFYNGIAKVPERFTLKLSDMFDHSDGQAALELVTQVFNINLGYNKALMERCRTLHDYAVFVDLVRRYRKETSLDAAVEKAIDECISNGVLGDFLKENRAEVLKMGLYEYNQEEHIRMEREDAREEGRSEGLAEGRAEGRSEGVLYSLTSIIRKKHLKGKSLTEIADELEMDTDNIKDIYEWMNQEMDDEWIVNKLLKQTH